MSVLQGKNEDINFGPIGYLVAQVDYLYIYISQLILKVEH